MALRTALESTSVRDAASSLPPFSLVILPLYPGTLKEGLHLGTANPADLGQDCFIVCCTFMQTIRNVGGLPSHVRFYPAWRMDVTMMGFLETCLSRLRQAALHMQQSPQEDNWPRAYVKDGVLVQGDQEGAEVRLPVHSQPLPNSACQVSHLPVRGRMYGWERVGSERCGGSLTSRKGGEQGWELSGRCQADIVVDDDRRIGEHRWLLAEMTDEDGGGLDIQSEAALVSTFRLPAPFWNVAAAQAVRQQQFCPGSSLSRSP